MATTKKKILFEHDDCDQISISSSSVSTESFDSYESNLPGELRQRQNRQKLFHIVNEVCSSEAKFVDTLRLLNIKFRNHIQDKTLNWPNQVNDCINNLLKHLPQLQELNENLLGELEPAREQWPRTQKISHILVKIGPFLKHYSSYIKEFEYNQAELNECMRKWPQFSEKIHEFENNEPEANKLCIQHHLLRPIQRIPQYRLLLQQYLHHLSPNDVDYEDTINALEVVSRVAEHANQSMNEGLNFSKLLSLQGRLVGKRCPIEPPIIRPGRVFVREGELMKISRKQVQSRWFILLNDALLYTTRLQSNDLLYLNQELPLDDECQVWTPEERKRSSQLVGQEFENEFSVCTRLRSFTLVAKCKQERDDWVRELRQSIEACILKRRSFCSPLTSTISHTIQTDSQDSYSTTLESNNTIDCNQVDSPVGANTADVIENSNPASVPINTNGQKHINNQQPPTGSSLLGQKAPLWTPDSRVSMCQLCASSFSALFRRHHCRACGRVVCSACSSNRAPLIYLKCRTARVCDQCFSELKANIHLYYLHASSRLNTTNNPSEIERELRRLDEHFRTLLKSQFERHVTMGPLKRALVAATTAGGQILCDNDSKQMKSELSPLGGAAANDSGSLISGYLHKRYLRKSKWKRHWYVMKDSALFAYRAIEDVVPTSCMSLRGYSIEQPDQPIDGLEPAILLRLYHATPMAINESDENDKKSSETSSSSLSGCKEISVLKTCIGNGLTQLANKNSRSTKSLVMEHLFKAESVGAAGRWLDAFRKSLCTGNRSRSSTSVRVDE